MLVVTARIIGALCMGFAALFACLNFYLSFIRPFYFWLKKEKYSHISGLPVIGNAFVIVAALLLPLDFYLGCLALLIVCLDTGGVPWFIYSMIYQQLHSSKTSGTEEN
jgi:hypothetical protein